MIELGFFLEFLVNPKVNLSPFLLKFEYVIPEGLSYTFNGLDCRFSLSIAHGET